MEVAISILALVLSIVALVWQWWTQRRQRTESLIIQNLTAMAELERSIGDVPGAFQFYGISERQISEAGFTPRELGFLISNMTIGGIFHRLSPIAGADTFKEKSYRYNLCRQARVRDAWPLIEPFLTDTPYKRRLIATLKLIHGESFKPSLPRRYPKSQDRHGKC